MKASLDATGRRLIREHNDRALLAWNIAALTRTTKKPQFDRLLAKPSAAKPSVQSWQQHMAIMGMWSARMRRLEASKPKAK